MRSVNDMRFRFVTFLILDDGNSNILSSQLSRPYALLFLSTIIGFTVTLLIKVLILTRLRRYFHSGFYRNKPAASNLLGLVLDCWYLGVSY